jgi:hypothetical protein
MFPNAFDPAALADATMEYTAVSPVWTAGKKRGFVKNGESKFAPTTGGPDSVIRDCQALSTNDESTMTATLFEMRLFTAATAVAGFAASSLMFSLTG